MKKIFLVIISLAFFASVWGRVEVNSLGQAGIGTSTPQAKLHVDGSVFLPAGSSYWINSPGDSGNRLRLHHTGNNGYIDFQSDLYIRSGSLVLPNGYFSSYFTSFKSDGRVWIGAIPDSSHDPDKLATLSLYGYGGYGAGSKISFGDFNTAQRVFVGEYGTADTDQLWLQGQNGVYLTRGTTASSVLAYCPSSSVDAFYFNTNVYSKTTLLTSDARFKSNVAKIQTPLNKLLSLNGVSYDFDYTPKIEKLQEEYLKNNNSYLVPEIDVPLTEEDGKDEKEKIERDNTQDTNTISQIETKMGFIAQDLQKIFPDLVKEDDMGFLAIDYIGLIPVIVEAMKEQQTQIEKQQEQIKQLVKLIDIKSINEKAFEENGIESIPILLQNTPNPFNQATEIGYYIPETVNSANIYIYDINGFQEKNISISERGKGATTLQAAALRAGIYFYTLICDGEPVDTKQMILTR